MPYSMECPCCGRTIYCGVPGEIACACGWSEAAQEDWEEEYNAWINQEPGEEAAGVEIGLACREIARHLPAPHAELKSLSAWIRIHPERFPAPSEAFCARLRGAYGHLSEGAIRHLATVTNAWMAMKAVQIAEGRRKAAGGN
jgi:hypothetical protein